MVKQAKTTWTQDVILSGLRRQLTQQRPVTLFNTFKGVPITYEAEIAMVSKDTVGVIVHPYQAVSIKQERRTYIECKGIPELIRAHPVSIDFTNRVVLLDQLKIPHNISVDLCHLWIKPKKVVRVDLDSDLDSRWEGELLSLAVLPGNNVRVVIQVPEEFSYERDDILDLAFKLPTSGELVQVGGVVHSLTNLRNTPERRLEVEGKAVMPDEIALLAYIAFREDEIIRDLDEDYWKLRHGVRGK